MKATNTMIVAFVTCLLSYIPAIVHSICVANSFEVDEGWSRYCSILGLFVSSASNPIVYALRTRRFRHALGQLWKDPFGKSPLQEMKEGRKPQKKKPSEQKETCRADSKDGKNECTMESIDQMGECRVACSSMEELCQERNAKARAALSERRKKNLKRSSSVGISENRRCKSI